jgi:hypothetical protein
MLRAKSAIKAATGHSKSKTPLLQKDKVCSTLTDARKSENARSTDLFRVKAATWVKVQGL